MVALACSTTTRAEHGVTVTVGAGASHDSYRSHRNGSYAMLVQRDHWGPTVTIDAAYRVVDQLAVGVHLAVSRAWTAEGVTCVAHGAVTPVLLGVTAEYTVLDRLWVGAWIGEADIETSFTYAGMCGIGVYSGGDREQRPAYGLSLGVDAYRNGRQRIGPFVQISRARETVDSFDNGSQAGTYPEEYAQDVVFAFGVAYRAW